MEFTLSFLKLFFFGLYLAAPILLALMLIIISLGLRVGKNENWSRYDSLYWSFITATTVGFGDFRPTKKICKAMAVIIAFTGLVTSGIIVAIAVDSAMGAFKTERDLDSVRTHIQSFKN